MPRKVIAGGWLVVRAWNLIVGLDGAFDNFWFLLQEFGEMLLDVVRSQVHGLIRAGLILEDPDGSTLSISRVEPIVTLKTFRRILFPGGWREGFSLSIRCADCRHGRLETLDFLFQVGKSHLSSRQVAVPAQGFQFHHRRVSRLGGEMAH